MKQSAETNFEKLSLLVHEIHSRGLPHYPLLTIFFTGTGDPADCVAMPRLPRLKVGFELTADLSEHFKAALLTNPSAHDGAIAFVRPSLEEGYRCAGWSYRIVAQTVAPAANPNRGAAYNSAISLSLTPGIDCVCLFAPDALEIFVRGESKK